MLAQASDRSEISRAIRSGARLVAILLAVAALGCNSDEVVTELPENHGKLRGVSMLYSRAATQLGRAPKTREDLLAPLAGKGVENPEDLLKSSRDGEFFEVVWGLDLVGKDRGYSGPIAFEKTGVDGKREFVNARRQISEANQAEFEQLPFPEGYKLQID